MTARADFHKKFKFVVRIDGVVVAAFQKMSELSAEAAKVEYFEGGSLRPDKSPGRVTYTDVTLERGATTDDDLYQWWKQVVDGGADAGLTDSGIKRDVDLEQQDRTGAVVKRWRIFRAWPQKFTAGEWDNESDENVIEMVVLTYDYFDRIAA